MPQQTRHGLCSRWCSQRSRLLLNSRIDHGASRSDAQLSQLSLQSHANVTDLCLRPPRRQRERPSASIGAEVEEHAFMNSSKDAVDAVPRRPRWMAMGTLFTVGGVLIGLNALHILLVAFGNITDF